MLSQKDMDGMIELHSLRVGDRVTIGYPNGILQEALLVGNDGGRLTFHSGEFVSDCVAPILDMFHKGRGGWGVGSVRNSTPGTVALCIASCGLFWTRAERTPAIFQNGV